MNEFFINSFNQFTLQAFNPYGYYHYTVLIVSPNFPDAPPSGFETPEVTVADFMKWCGSFIDVDNENNVFNPLIQALLSIARTYIDVNLIGDDNDFIQYKRIVSLYVGHYLELHLEILKDEGNKNTLDPESKEYKIEFEIPMASIGDFKRTRFGQMFWSIYGAISRWGFQEKYSTWGGL